MSDERGYGGYGGQGGFGDGTGYTPAPQDQPQEQQPYQQGQSYQQDQQNQQYGQYQEYQQYADPQQYQGYQGYETYQETPQGYGQSYPQNYAQGYTGYEQQQGYGYDPGQQFPQQQTAYGYQQAPGQPGQPGQPVAEPEEPAPLQAAPMTPSGTYRIHDLGATPPPPTRPAPAPAPGPTPAPPGRDERVKGSVPSPRRSYGEDEFGFVDDESEQAEDVIDWLAFAETRSERRDERRKSIRVKLLAVAAAVALVLVAIGGWYGFKAVSGGGSSSSSVGTAGHGAVLVQLRGADGKSEANVVMAVDPAHNKASVMSVASVLKVNSQSEGGPAPLGDVLLSDGSGASRDALSGVLGVKLDGSWVVSEPVLQGLVDMAGGIQLNADQQVPGPNGTVAVAAGPSRVNGTAALAYAKFQAPGEDPTKVANRFAQVLDAVLTVLPKQATTVQTMLRNLANVADPSLPDTRLASFLASLATSAQAQLLKSGTLPVQPDGTVDAATAGPVVSDLLGGTVQVAKDDGPARVMIEDATGKQGGQESARVLVVNAGLTYVPGGAVDAKARATSLVQYTDPAQRQAAETVAQTLGLPATAVQQAQGQMLADVVVTLGQDFTPPPVS